MSRAELVLVAPGTRSRVGVETVAALPDAVAERVGVVHPAFVDLVAARYLLAAPSSRISSRSRVAVPRSTVR